MLYLPTLYLRDGRLVRRAEFPTAELAFRGSLGDAVKFFGEQAGLRAFHLVVEDDPPSEPRRSTRGPCRAENSTPIIAPS
jgi:hypothetical protein